MSLVFSKSRQPQIIMTVFCQGLQSLACLLVSFLYDCSGYHQEFVSVNLRLRRLVVVFPLLPFLHFIGFSLSRQIFWSVSFPSPPIFAERDRIQVPIKILQFSFDRKKKDVFHICQRCVFSTFNCHSGGQTFFLFPSLKSHSFSREQKGVFH